MSTTLQVKLKDKDGNYLQPQTKANLVLTSDGTGTLANVLPSAQLNIILTIKVNDTTLTPTNKIVTITVPTVYTALNTDGYMTKALVDSAIAAAGHLTRKVVTQLPAQGELNVIYMLKRTTPTTSNVYDLYMWINSAWLLIGSTLTDLDQYAKLESPTFTGTPKAPTAASDDNSTQIATTAFVKTAVAEIAASSVLYEVIE